VRPRTEKTHLCDRQSERLGCLASHPKKCDLLNGRLGKRARTMKNTSTSQTYCADLARLISLGLMNCGYLPFKQVWCPRSCFHLLSKRMSTTSVLITTNLTYLNVERICGCQNTKRLAHILTHHCHIVETGNQSYRFLHSTNKRRLRSKRRAKRLAFKGGQRN